MRPNSRHRRVAQFPAEAMASRIGLVCCWFAASTMLVSNTAQAWGAEAPAVISQQTPETASQVASSDAAPESADATSPARPNERARRTYMGRIVAQPMSHRGAAWLIRPERNDEENALEALGELRIEPGMTVVDLGCGNGYWTLPMARKCASEQRDSGDIDLAEQDDDAGESGAGESGAGDGAPSAGQVLAVDIQPQMLQKLRQNMLRAKIDNIQPILGKVDDPKLPVGEVDLVLLVDVYHEFSHPVSMLWAIRRSLKSDGVVALLEYRAEDPEVPIKPLHKMSKNQIMKEYAAANMKLVREYNDLPWQHLMFFARDDSSLPEIEPK
ncbi:class I SAM-dependent methyltransferase [Allorhodopirellula solitaria]|uniref:Methyltransferase type 11 domain-containing protein n=1 Tax=Allorhodopirellula solitaria TaxID=2527987 RepID=A0A5C5WPL6_9BACT|nr:class I SAM-dependent methyltransferase [Allorhodopirellula solitaria]TWT52370.1 hypothetical protein CA85_50240 [Allorhodopirellula solitaria]